MGRAAFVGAAAALLALLAPCAGASAQYAGPQLSLVGEAPGALVLEPTANGGALATVALRVRNDSDRDGDLAVRLLLDDGSEAAAGGAAAAAGGVALAFDPRAPGALKARDVASLRLKLRVAANGPSAVSGTLVVTLRGDGAVSPLAVPLSAATGSTGAAALGFARAKVQPDAIAMSAGECVPALLGRHCDAPATQRVSVEGLTVAGAVDAETVVAETVVAADDGDGRATVRLRTVHEIAPGVEAAPFDVVVEGLDRGGIYAAELPLSSAEGAPTLTVKTVARDSVVWLLLMLLLGAAAAYLWVRYRDRGRPAAVGEIALLDLRARHARDRDALGSGTPHYTLAGVLYADERTGTSIADELLASIRRSRSQADLDERVDELRALAGAVEQWLPACREAAALSEARSFPGPVDPSLLVRETDALLAVDTPAEARRLPAGADEAAALVRRLAQQRAFIARWLVAAELLRIGEELFGQLTAAEQERLRPHRPSRLAPELRAAVTAEQLDASGLEAALREDVRLLRALASPPAPVRELAESAERGAEGAGTTAARLLSPAASHRETSADGARALRGRLVRIDIFDFAFAAAVAALVVVPTLYGETFGTTWDYLAVFAAGAGAQLAITWQLLPWYRSTRLPKKAA